MTRFVAIKVHYDHRQHLPKHLKYSVAPTEEEYNDYLELYATGVGGEGFHECMNFAIPDRGHVPLYLPPTCLPAEKISDEEFVFFTFTYKEDRERPASIVGVHGMSEIVSLDGLPRTDVTLDFLDVDLVYHAVARPEYVTLFTKPLSYDFKVGVYTPSYSLWGYGLRYIERSHAQKIVEDAFSATYNTLPEQTETEAMVSRRELEVLNRIHMRYFGAGLEVTGEEPPSPPLNPPEPNPEIEFMGERAVYEREISYVKGQGIPTTYVEWISQVEPNSVYDIRSARIENGEIKTHYVEVKSSAMEIGQNILVSHRQLDFFRSNTENTSIVLVKLGHEGAAPSLEYLSAAEFLDQFEFQPLKYRAVPRGRT